MGILYFLGLWWVTLRFVQGSPALPTIALMLARGLLLVVALVLASRAGALQLLAIAFGILLARSAMIRHVRKEAP